MPHTTTLGIGDKSTQEPHAHIIIYAVILRT